MAAWITARRICVQVIFLDSWLDSFMEISVFCQFKMRMEQKEVTELADGHGGVKEESVSPVFHNHIMLSLWSGTSRSAIFVCRFAGGGWNAGGVSVVSGNAGGRRIACQVYRSLSGLQCLHYFGGCLACGNQLEFGILAQVVETDARSPQYVHLGDVLHSELCHRMGAEASDTVRKYAQIAHLYLLSVQQLLAQAVHGKQTGSNHENIADEIVPQFHPHRRLLLPCWPVETLCCRHACRNSLAPLPAETPAARRV